jgi:hypothetical protein
LELTNCYDLTDVSALGNVHILNLGESTGVMDVSALKNVYELHLESFSGNNLNGLENVVKLFLDDSYLIADISMLKVVKELHVAQCPLITDFHGLKNLQILEIGRRNESKVGFDVSLDLEIFECLVELRARWVHFFEGTRDPNDSEKFLSLSDFPKVQTLILHECVFSHFPTVFSHLLTLNLIWCSGFSVLPGFPSLDSLQIIGCFELTELHISSARENYPICNVKITACENLQELRISRKISQFRISDCSELSRLVVERQINFLRVKRCPKLRGISQSAPIICSEWEVYSEEKEENEDEDEQEDTNDDSGEESEETEENNSIEDFFYDNDEENEESNED